MYLCICSLFHFQGNVFVYKCLVQCADAKVTFLGVTHLPEFPLHTRLRVFVHFMLLPTFDKIWPSVPFVVSFNAWSICIIVIIRFVCTSFWLKSQHVLMDSERLPCHILCGKTCDSFENSVAFWKSIGAFNRINLMLSPDLAIFRISHQYMYGVWNKSLMQRSS